MSETTAVAATTERKWTTEAGPIQSKKVREALLAITSEGRSYVELTGVKDVDEHRFEFNSPFSPPSAASVAAAKAVAEKFDYKVTRENYAAIVAECGNQVRVLVQNRPVIDKRVTAEARAKQIEEQKEKGLRAEVPEELQQGWLSVVDDFRHEIRKLAAASKRRVGEVYAKWREYCANQGDMSCIVSEFTEINREWLTPGYKVGGQVVATEQQARDIANARHEKDGVILGIERVQGAEVRHNKEKDGVEIHFADMPPRAVLSKCKAAGFRWSRFSSCWYNRLNATTWREAHTIAGLQPAPFPNPPQVDRFDMAVEDQMAAQCGL